MKENFKDMLLESGSGYMMPFALEEKEELPTTLGYGKQRHPMTGEEFNHLGVDFAIKNRDLYAVASGMIVSANDVFSTMLPYRSQIWEVRSYLWASSRSIYRIW